MRLVWPGSHIGFIRRQLNGCSGETKRVLTYYMKHSASNKLCLLSEARQIKYATKTSSLPDTQPKSFNNRPTRGSWKRRRRFYEESIASKSSYNTHSVFLSLMEITKQTVPFLFWERNKPAAVTNGCILQSESDIIRDSSACTTHQETINLHTYRIAALDVMNITAGICFEISWKC